MFRLRHAKREEARRVAFNWTGEGLPPECKQCKARLIFWIVLAASACVLLLVLGCRSPAPPGYEDDWTPGTNTEWRTMNMPHGY